jgi:hypothetical protein
MVAVAFLETYVISSNAFVYLSGLKTPLIAKL